jgi:hypothetical protein
MRMSERRERWKGEMKDERSPLRRVEEGQEKSGVFEEQGKLRSTSESYKKC